MDPVVHFEMPAVDKKRTKKFYEAAFGWHMTQLGVDMSDYLLATTSPVDKKMMHTKKGAINGGFFKRSKSGTVPHLIISVKNLAKSMEQVTKAKGKVLGKPTEIPGVGQFVMIKDTEGNKVGVLQPARRR